MGMFDTIVVLGPDLERFRCAAGHPLDDDLQTKDLDAPALRTFYVVRGRLYQVSREHGRPQAGEAEHRPLSRRLPVPAHLARSAALAIAICER